MKTLKKFGATAAFASVLVGGGSVAAAGSASTAGVAVLSISFPDPQPWTSNLHDAHFHERRCGGRNVVCMSIA